MSTRKECMDPMKNPKELYRLENHIVRLLVMISDAGDFCAACFREWKYSGCGKATSAFKNITARIHNTHMHL